MNAISEDDSLSKADFWQKVAAFSFGLWALMLPIAAGIVITSVSRFTEKFDGYVLAMERRVTLLEERQSRILRVLEEQHNTRQGDK